MPYSPLSHVPSVFRLSLVAALIGACTVSPTLGGTSAGTGALSQVRTALSAQVLLAPAVPADLIAATLAPAQRAADDASRRRGIDFFNLHGNPVGMRLLSGTAEGTVLSFLGTSKDRTDLNVELRALVGAGSPAIIMNYSGPVTLSNRTLPAAVPAVPAAGTAAGLRFTLMTGLPGDGSVDAYGDFLDHLGELLRQRYGADRYAFDDGPLIFAAGDPETPAGYVFCNQGTRLVLGDRKYADVQAVTALDPAGRMLANYVLIGFNAKTTGSSQIPTYRVSQDSRFGTLVEFGEH